MVLSKQYNVEEASVFDCADHLKITPTYISSSQSAQVGGVVMHQPDVISVSLSA